MKKQKKRHRIVKGILLLLFICLMGVGYANYKVLSASDGRVYDTTDAIPHRDTALLLGTNPKTKTGKRSTYYYHRILAAAQLYKEGKFDRIILSGAAIAPDYDEPASMREDLMQLGVPDSIMVLDKEGFRTINSIARAKEVFHTDSILLISQDFHNRRAIYQAKHYGIDAIGFNAADSPYRFSRLKNHLREYIARVKAVMEVGNL